MSFILVVKPEAIGEAARIYAYHQQVGQRLADRFSKELDACYSFISRDPTALPIRKKNYRHMMVWRFRYRVVYDVVGSEVIVYQVHHTSRKVSKEFGP